MKTTIIRHRVRALAALSMAALFWAAHRPACAADPALIAAEQQRVEVMARAAPTVVAIFARGGQGGGSGVLISADGYALTNYHVTHGSGNFMKCGLPDGVLYDAVIVGLDPTGDVALIKLLGREDFPCATFADSDELTVGDWVFAMGNPFLLATDFHPTVTYGIVSGVHRYQYPSGTILEYTDCIQVDASINPGNSGGPLFDAAGGLVGINGRGSFEKRGRVNSGAGYAISINQIKHFLDNLKSGRVVDHATLGAVVATRSDGAVVVSNILEESEAYRRGLRQDDEIVSFAGRPIGSVNQFKNVLGIYPDGWRLPVVYRRDGKKQEIFVRLRPLHRASELTSNEAAPERRPRKPMPQPGQPREPEENRPGQNPKPADAAAPQPPRQFAALFVAKPGYANYYFNELERKRVLAGLKLFGRAAAERGVWKASGRLGQEATFDLTLADQGAGLLIDGGKKTAVQSFAPGAALEDEPPGTGGLLVALHHFRLLITRGPEAFSDFYYLGSEPFDGIGPRVDVLAGEISGAKSYWFFQRDSKEFVGLDLFLSENVDACELRIESLRDFSGVRLPGRLFIRHAGRDYGTLSFESFTFLPKTENAARPDQPAEAATSLAN